jgi:hypothetical protein
MSVVSGMKKVRLDGYLYCHMEKWLKKISIGW